MDYIFIGLKYGLVHLARSWLVFPQMRPLLLKMCGHTFSDARSVFIGADVMFDNVRGAKTHVGRSVTIATGAKIMNHYIVPDGLNQNYTKGDVYIDDDVFIGMNVLIVQPVKIGKNSLVAAGSVVTSDIPPNVLVAGSPARVIKQLPEKSA
ncbi:MAG: acyltransferase [Azonexus sp.]|jgi:acetyltransferase-like isoleucine patch superfamily enzyme|nr:acyltransferase [Azonexus sp.]